MRAALAVCQAEDCPHPTVPKPLRQLDTLPPECIDDHAERGERAVWGARLSECFLPPGEVPEHDHPHDGLAVLLGGSLEEQHDGRWQPLGAGRVLRQFRGRAHSLRIGPRGAHVFRLRFRLDADLPERAPLFAPPALLPVMQRLYALFADPSTPMTALAGWMLDAEQNLKREARRARTAPRWMDEAEHLLAGHALAGDIGRVAEALGVSRSHLNRSFHQQHGCNPAEWLRRRRVFSACQPLRDSRKPIAEIALELGYADQAHFSRVFRQSVGMTPLRYRQSGHA